MKLSRTNQFLTLLCFILVTACQHREQRDNQENNQKQDYIYKPQKGALLVISNSSNPELKSVTLFKDNEKDSIMSVTSENGKFKLEVDSVDLNEVYFIKIKGKSTKSGTNGLAWEASVPVLAAPAVKLELVQNAFNHVGSISKVSFSIQGGGEEQEFLNSWHCALAIQEAEEEGQMEQYAIGGASVTKVAGKKKLAKTPMSITEDFIGQHKPLISSFYFISTVAKQRQYAQEYQKLFDQASDTAKHSKYGVDLAKRLEQIGTKIAQLDLKKQVVATDARLSEIPWDSLKNRKYLLLSFWNSEDQASADTVKKLKNSTPELEKKGVEVLFISMESQFSKWKKNTAQLGVEYNYRMRNEVQQDLINTLYLSELPRLVLVKPNGKVVNDDFSMKQLGELE